MRQFPAAGPRPVDDDDLTPAQTYAHERAVLRAEIRQHAALAEALVDTHIDALLAGMPCPLNDGLTRSWSRQRALADGLTLQLCVMPLPTPDWQRRRELQA